MPSTIVYWSPGVTGSGHVVEGLSILQGLRRAGWKGAFHIICASPAYTKIARGFSCAVHVWMPHSPHELARSGLDDIHQLIENLEPDLILIDQFWWAAQSWIGQLSVPTVLLLRRSHPAFFKPQTFGFADNFLPDPQAFSRLVCIEPCPLSPEFSQAQPVNPLIIRNHEEILPPAVARQALIELYQKTSPPRATQRIAQDAPICLITVNGEPGELEKIRRDYAYLSDEGWVVLWSSNLKGQDKLSLFPAVDWFAGVDLLICPAGPNAFWEAIWFDMEAIFIPQQRQFDDQAGRIREAEGYSFDQNGADKLAILLNSNVND